MESYALGLGEPVQVSAEHGEGLSELYDALRVLMPEPVYDDEIEGDAAFLSRPTGTRDPDTTVSDILQVAVAMHRAFHRERQYVATNLCPCGGCREAGNLKLKFVAHVGDVATQAIKERIKLVGIDVILVHRLLKNPVGIPEYVLLSEELYRSAEESLPVAAHEISPELEGFGTVRAYYLDVGELDGHLPALPEPTWPVRLGRTAVAAGLGLPYQLGLRSRRRNATAT